MGRIINAWLEYLPDALKPLLISGEEGNPFYNPAAHMIKKGLENIIGSCLNDADDDVILSALDDVVRIFLVYRLSPVDIVDFIKKGEIVIGSFVESGAGNIDKISQLAVIRADRWRDVLQSIKSSYSADTAGYGRHNHSDRKGVNR